MTRVVAIVPAKDRADSIADTVTALRGLGRVDRVLVVDDGSRDDTTAAARRAGAEVLRLPRNRGKGGAVLAGVAATPDADVYLLIDADLAATAGAADALLDPVLAGTADLTVGVLPSAGGKGGFGLVRDAARRGIARACGRTVRAPLSGQRAAKAGLLRDLTDAGHYGLEVAMTIDAERAGARIVEIDVPMDHRHTGRSVSGFAHRAQQGLDVTRVLWPRLTTPRRRIGLALLVLVVTVLAALWSGSRWVPDSEPLTDEPRRVIVFGMAPMGFGDIDPETTPVLVRMMGEGATAAMSVRTVSRSPSLPEGYLSLGAGDRLEARAGASEAYATDARLGTGTAGEVLSARLGRRVSGEVAVIGAPATLDANRDATVTSGPGSLQDALADDGKEAAIVGNGDQPDSVRRTPVVNRPAALAAMGGDLSVQQGTVQPEKLLRNDPSAPFGVRADPEKVLTAIADAAEDAELLVVDPGDLERAEAFRATASVRGQNRARRLALRRTDALLGDVLEWAGDDTLVMVVSVAPPGRGFRLTPITVAGPGVESGWLVSPSTKRRGLVTLTDVAPTVLSALGASVPDGMRGAGLRQQPGSVDTDALQVLDRDTEFRELTYYNQAVWFIVFQAVVYLLAAFVLARNSRVPRTGPAVRVLALASATFPLSTFVFRMIPGWSAVGWLVWPILIAITAAITALASRARGHPLRPLNWVMGLTLFVILVDACTGTRLHLDSWLGYSLHSAGRFYGIPNTSFAVIASTAVLLACSFVHYSGRRSEAVLIVTPMLAFVALADGLPSLGGDVGGIISLVPLFGLTLIALSGRRLRLRTVLLLGLLTIGVVAFAAGLDLLREPEARTHLGRFAARLADRGLPELTDTFLRKQSTNLRILKVSIWTWMVPIMAGFLLYLLVWERQWAAVLPPGSPLRVGAVSVVSGALLGFLANDSGPILIALFIVYLLPYVTLVALDRSTEPQLLGPLEPVPERAPPVPVDPVRAR